MELNISNINLNLPKENKFVSPGIHNREINFSPYEPMRMYRYVISYISEAGNFEWYVDSLSTPSIRMERSDDGFMLRQTWDRIEMTFRDLIGPPPNNPRRDLYNWFNNGEKRDIVVEKLDPTGVVAERWLLHNCLLTSIPMTISEEWKNTFMFLPDYCTLTI